MARHWTRFYAGEGDDFRPIKVGGEPEWWCTGERIGAEPAFVICAIIEAKDEAAAWAIVDEYWPENERHSCDPRADDWRPPTDRFPPRKDMPRHG